MSKKGFTLIEILVAVSIASFLTTGIANLLDTALTSWRFSLEEANISKLAEETMLRMADGDYELPGIRDAMEIIEAGRTSIGFVPLWTDFFDQVPSDGKFMLSRRIRRGSVPPVGEIRFPDKEAFHPYKMTLVSDQAGGREWAEFGFPVPKGAVVRIAYQPDYTVHPEMVMRYEWNEKEQRIIRSYNKEVTDFNLKRSQVFATKVEFVYYNSSNQVIKFNGNNIREKNKIIQITAVKITAAFKGKDLTRSYESFVNIRALGKAGQGIILSEGLQVPIPNSSEIQALQLVNFAGVSEGATVEVSIHSLNNNDVYRLKLYLGVQEGMPVLRKLEVFYPEDKLVFESTEEKFLRHGFDFLTIGLNGMYDYDKDMKGGDRVLFLKDPVFLQVDQLGVEGLMLIVRP